MIRFHLYELTRVNKFKETENRMVATRGWRTQGMGNYCLRGTISVMGDEKVSGDRQW